MKTCDGCDAELGERDIHEVNLDGAWTVLCDGCYDDTMDCIRETVEGEWFTLPEYAN